MSYILEALKKSEYARQQGKVPDLNTLSVVLPPAQGRRSDPKLAYALVGAAVVALVAVLVWLRPWQMPAPAVVTVPTAPMAGVASPQDFAQVPQPRAAGEPLAAPSSVQRQAAPGVPVPPQAPAPVADAVLPGAVAPSAISAPTPFPASAPPPAPETALSAPIASTPPGVPTATPADPPLPRPAASAAAVTRPPAAKVAPAVPAPVKPAATPRVASAPAKPAVAPSARPPASVRDVAAPPSPTRVYRRSELPDAIRSSLPPLTVSGYAYAVLAEERMAVINDRVLQEGDEAAPGVMVGNIDSDGLVLVFRGYRFRP